MTAATEDPLAAQARTVRARTVQTQTVQTQTAQTQTAQAHLVQAESEQAGTVRTHRLFIQATPEEIWDALTRPGWTQLYSYPIPAQYEMRPGGAYRAFASVTMKMQGVGGVIFDGEVIEADAAVAARPDLARPAATPVPRAESDTRLSWEIAEGNVWRERADAHPRPGRAHRKRRRWWRGGTRRARRLGLAPQ